jgi:hydroxymethylglutaryl-CoA reductase
MNMGANAVSAASRSVARTIFGDIGHTPRSVCSSVSSNSCTSVIVIDLGCVGRGLSFVDSDRI